MFSAIYTLCKNFCKQAAVWRKRIMKLRTKILLMCLGCTLSALVLQTFLFQEASSSLIYEQAKEASENSLENMQNEIYSMARNIENNLIEVYTDQELIESLKTDTSVDSLRAEYYRQAYDIATSEFETEDDVVSLYLYTMDHEIISTYRRAVTPKHNYQVDIYEDADMENARTVMDYVESDEDTMLISSYYNPYREKDILRFVLKLYDDGNRNKKIGYIVCDVDSKAILGIMEKYQTDSTVFIWLQPDGDRPAAILGELTDEQKEYYEDVSDIILKGEKITRQKYFEQELFQAEQSKYDLTAYSLMPQRVLQQNQRNLTVNLLLIGGIMVLVSAVLSMLISRNLTRPLESLMRTIQKIKNGDTELRAKLENKDEIGELGRNFNEMLDQMEELKEKENQTNQLLSQARYNALQAQINPHFLYNTLDTMSSIAENRECPEVSLLSQSLSNIFRYSLNMKEPFSTVARELMHLKNYTYIMSVRMQDNVQYSFDVDKDVMQDKIPRLSLQPLVENALNHGLRNKRGEKWIEIKAKRANGELHVSVRDNGVGMDAQKMNESLKENTAERSETGRSIGLHNINARLKMLYGEQYGLYIESRKDEGTCVSMRLPEKRGEE